MNVKTLLSMGFVLIGAAIIFVGFSAANAPAGGGHEFMQVTTIESVVPGGLGRSRMITIDGSGNMEEVKLENFYSLVGINFKNVRFNDQAITSKISALSQQGWELVQVTSGVESTPEKTGIFITRYLFRK